jgi:soluble lytic murein transglycosylase-like protein
MRPLYRLRRVVAALAWVAVWFASLAGMARPVSGAPDPSAVIAAVDPFCSTRLDEAWLVVQQQEVRLDRDETARQQEEERMEAAQLQRRRAEVRREDARRHVVTQRIDDLVPEEYQDLVLDVAAQFGLDPRLVAAVGTVESRWHPRSLGSHGDSGLMQIIPSTASWIAAKLGMEVYDVYDPVTNLTMGAWYLSVLHQEYGDWNKALAAYNGGPRAAAMGADFPYTRLVMKVYGQQGS